MEKIDRSVQTILDVIVDDKIIGLDNIMRFNGIRVHKPESVSQHSFWVAAIAAILLEDTFEVNKRTVEILDFKHRVVTFCLFHDSDEVITGDILFPLKYNNYNGSKIRECLSKFLINENSKINTSEISKKICFILNPEYGAYKEEKALIKICDWLACIKYVNQEISMGNIRMWEMLELCEEHLLNQLEIFISLMKNNFNDFKIDTYLRIKHQLKNKLQNNGKSI